jgi:hypothetical protein
LVTINTLLSTKQHFSPSWPTGDDEWRVMRSVIICGLPQMHLTRVLVKLLSLQLDPLLFETTTKTWRWIRPLTSPVVYTAQNEFKYTYIQNREKNYESSPTTLEVLKMLRSNSIVGCAGYNILCWIKLRL